MIDTPAWNRVRSALEANELTDALDSFRQIEADVETLIREVEGFRQVERDLRSALEADGSAGAQFQRR